MLKELLQKWHWLHTWGPWQNGQVYYVSYPWTKPGCVAYGMLTQTRSCKACNIMETRTQTVV